MLKEHDITDIIPLEEYRGMNEKMKFKCSCGDTWETTPYRVIIGNHCKKCGNKKKHLTLDDRVYHCKSCGNTIDRDLNAAINLLNLKNGKCVIYDFA